MSAVTEPGTAVAVALLELRKLMATSTLQAMEMQRQMQQLQLQLAEQGGTIGNLQAALSAARLQVVTLENRALLAEARAAEVEDEMTRGAAAASALALIAELGGGRKPAVEKGKCGLDYHALWASIDALRTRSLEWLRSKV